MDAQNPWPGLEAFTEDDQLEHLRTLQQAAKRSKAKYLATKRKVKENIPFWMDEREQNEAESLHRNNQFKERVDSFNL